MFRKIENLLRCPITGNKIYYSESDNCYKVRNSDIVYPVINDIILFLNPNAKSIQLKSIWDSYKFLTYIYDSLLTRSNLITKIFFKIVWDFNYEYEDYVNAGINDISDDFDGILLDVPVGTGVFTVEKYKKLKNAAIIVLEYSLKMLLEAKRKYTSAGIKNVIYIHGDVGNLPFNTDSIDYILSMNGFHVFPDKERALLEIHRTLKNKGRFSATFYIKGRRILSDIIVKIFHSFRILGIYNPSKTDLISLKLNC